MQDYGRYFDVEDMFCNLFFLAGKYGIKKDIFTHRLEGTNFVLSIEKGDYSNAYNQSVLDVFNDMIRLQLSSGDVDEEWDDYYWVGKVYFYIQNETHKPFSYIFLKFPFETVYKLFNPYHEMDMSQLLDVFYEEEKKTTIIKELSKRWKISTNTISKDTGIPFTTLTKYRKSDQYLYKASFANIYKLVEYFKAPLTLFLETVPQEK